VKIIATSIVDLKRTAPLRQHHFIRHLAQKHHVTVLCVNDWWKADQPGNGRYLEGFDCGTSDFLYLSEKRISPLLQELTAGPMIANLLRHNTFDVHLNLSGLISGYAVTKRLHDMGVPTVYDIADDLPKMTAHSPQIPVMCRGIGKTMATRFMRDTARLSSEITYVTENLRAKYAEAHSASSVLPNGVDLEMFQPRPVAHEGFVVGFVGALRQWVDLAPVFQAVSQTQNRMLVVGDEGGLAANKALANKYLPTSDITFTGTVPFVKVPEYINAMDVVVFPFKFDNPMPLAALQAMACGKPIISTRMLEIGCNAIRYSPDAGSYRRRIEDLVAHPNVGHNLGMEGRRYVEANHDWGKLTTHMESLLEYVARRSHD
jgi:glycosyltransferase involved in cell wall biosynthesis